MWILKNSSNLLSSLSHLGVHRATSIQTFDFSTLYTSIPRDLLKSRMNSIINNAFKYKNGATRYTHVKVGRIKSYFTSDPLNGDNKYTTNETTESTSIASYLVLLFIRDKSNNITTKLYDKRDAFGFHIVNFSFMSSNIPSAPAYGVYASQLIRYARCCSNYSDFYYATGSW